MRRMLALLAVAVAAAACHNDEDGYDPTVPTQMEVLSGDEQFADAGTAVPSPLVVVVKNLRGDPVSGVSVEWFTPNVGGSVSASATLTDVNGRAQVNWQLGPTVGDQTASAVNNVLVGSPVVFTAHARPSGGGGDDDDDGGGAGS